MLQHLKNATMIEMNWLSWYQKSRPGVTFVGPGDPLFGRCQTLRGHFLALKRPPNDPSPPGATLFLSAIDL